MYQFHTMCISETYVYINIYAYISTAYVKHMPMATTIRQDLTRPGSAS